MTVRSHWLKPGGIHANFKLINYYISNSVFNFLCQFKLTWGMASLQRCALIFASVFVMHFFGQEALCSKSNNRNTGEGLLFANFARDLNHYLNATKVGSYDVHGVDACPFKCLCTHSCLSLNVAAHPDIHGQFLCELLATDKYNSSDKFLQHSDFHHYSIQVSYFTPLF